MTHGNAARAPSRPGRAPWIGAWLAVAVLLPATTVAQAALPRPGTPIPSPALDACLAKAGGVTVAVETCQQTELDRRNAELNRTYQATLRRLPPARQAALRQEERDWIRRRDAACRPAAQPDAGGTAAGIDALDCTLRETRDRTAALAAYR